MQRVQKEKGAEEEASRCTCERIVDGVQKAMIVRVQCSRVAGERLLVLLLQLQVEWTGRAVAVALGETVVTATQADRSLRTRKVGRRLASFVDCRPSSCRSLLVTPLLLHTPSALSTRVSVDSMA